MNDNGLTLYRKYRPQTFKEFVNQEVIKRTLQNTILLNKISHAYLFAGPRGTGKTSMARLFAKTINCLNPQIKNENIEPCNKCQNCLDFNSLKAVDLIEIDAASNRGIDEIRELKEAVKFAPVKSQYKVYIIDEAQMLTKEAFNALLKTLEEPPSYIIFILATTEVEKIPITILSRVQRFDFRKLKAVEISQKLEEIQKLENIKIEKPAINLISQLANGSIRDAESILSQLIAFSFDRLITLKEVEQILGAINFENLKPFLYSLANNDLEKSLSFINEIQAKGYQPYEVLRFTLSILEKILILNLNKNYQKELQNEFSQEEVSVLEELAKMFNIQKLKLLIREFLIILPQIKKAFIPTLPIEMVIIEVLTKD